MHGFQTKAAALVGDRLQQVKAGHGRSTDRSMLCLYVRTERKRADEDHGRQDEDDERRAAQPRDQLPHAVLPRDGGHERHAREVSSCRIIKTKTATDVC